jgi:hypothetical protein
MAQVRDMSDRRSELVALQSNDLNFTKDGSLTGMIRKSKTDRFARAMLTKLSKKPW